MVIDVHWPQYTHKYNYYVAHWKLTWCCMLITSRFLKKSVTCGFEVWGEWVLGNRGSCLARSQRAGSRWSYLKSRNTETEIESKCRDTKRGGGVCVGDEFADWDWHKCATIHKTGNWWEPTAQHRGRHSLLLGDMSGQEVQKEGDRRVHTADPLCCTADTNTVKQMYSNQK